MAVPIPTECLRNAQIQIVRQSSRIGYPAHIAEG
jgi:hypothetical protein